MAKKDIGSEDYTPSPTLPLQGGVGDLVSVAYHDGPIAIGFCGRRWQRDVAQPVTVGEWAAMQARGDFNEFDFKQEQ